MDQNSTSTLKLLFCLESLNIKEHHYFVYFILAFSKMDQMNADQTSEKPTLQEGVNYRLIPGKHKNSKLIIVGNYAYKLEKLDKNVLYLFCKFPSCKARAKIKGNVFYSTSGSKVPHTCQSRGACAEFWEAHEALSRMKYRAELETTSYRVTICYLGYKLRHFGKILKIFGIFFEGLISSW